MAVAAVLAGAQALLAALALLAHIGGPVLLLSAVLLYVALASAAAKALGPVPSTAGASVSPAGP